MINKTLARYLTNSQIENSLIEVARSMFYCDVDTYCELDRHGNPTNIFRSVQNPNGSIQYQIDIDFSIINEMMSLPDTPILNEYIQGHYKYSPFFKYFKARKEFCDEFSVVKLPEKPAPVLSADNWTLEFNNDSEYNNFANKINIEVYTGWFECPYKLTLKLSNGDIINKNYIMVRKGHFKHQFDLKEEHETLIKLMRSYKG